MFCLLKIFIDLLYFAEKKNHFKSKYVLLRKSISLAV